MKESCHPGFRLFLSAEPSRSIPYSIIERSYKITSQPPSGMRANLKQALQQVKDEFDDKDAKIKIILFKICYFHASVLERTRYGSVGWTKPYSFRNADLRDAICKVLKNAEGDSSRLNSQELICVLGDIIYGGHVTESQDKKVLFEYLNIIFEKLDDQEAELTLLPIEKGLSIRCFASLTQAVQGVENNIIDCPQAIGLHPSSEVEFRIEEAAKLMQALLQLEPRESSELQDRSRLSMFGAIEEVIKRILEDDFLKVNLNIAESRLQAEGESEALARFFDHEIVLMSRLLEMLFSDLEELLNAIQGTVYFGEELEELMATLHVNKVPGRWVQVSFPTERSLQSWLGSLTCRVEELLHIKASPDISARIIHLSKMFNPQSFITSVKKHWLIKSGETGIDGLWVNFEPTKFSLAERKSVPRDGIYVFGLVLSGASWDAKAGVIHDCEPRKIHTALPIMLCRVLPARTCVFPRDEYQCPVYQTSRRDNVQFVVGLSGKREKDKDRQGRRTHNKWLLMGVAILLDVEGFEEKTLELADQPK
jgi:dynein heavy chain